MIIFEYKCRECEAIFEHVAPGRVGAAAGGDDLMVGGDNLVVDDSIGAVGAAAKVVCASCGASGAEQVKETMFKPNKAFCPKDTENFLDTVSGDLGKMLKDEEKKCAGCACGKSRYTLKSFK